MMAMKRSTGHSLYHQTAYLRRVGVLAALEEAGVQPGDMVHFGKEELLWGDEMF